ncbi:MAG: VWA domain-containing protein [Bernardetiaceae bacterium]|nr:VWA domain-containing protein [Bernardetiaceae bacterium]
MPEWFSIEWFTLSKYQEMDWEYPIFLYAIALIPLVFILKWLLFLRFRQKLEVAFPEKRNFSDPLALLRHVPKLFFALSLALILVALARPQKTDEVVEQWSEGIDIVLALDISESMAAIMDFKPNRLEAAKEVAMDFVSERKNDKIGIVLFAGDAYSLSPLTTDTDMLLQYIADIDPSLIPKGGTAIGNAIAVATNRLSEDNSASKVLILLTDGENTAGTIDPITAAKLAVSKNIKIYTIIIARPGRVPYRNRHGGVSYINETIDEQSMKEVAKIGNGYFFRATDSDALEQVFERIDTLEKSEIQESHYKNIQDFYQIYLIWAMISFLIWLLLKNTFMMSAIED